MAENGVWAEGEARVHDGERLSSDRQCGISKGETKRWAYRPNIHSDEVEDFRSLTANFS